MKLLSCFLLFLFIEMYHTRRIPTSENTIRVPLRRVHTTLNELNASNTDPKIIRLDDKRPSVCSNILIGSEPQEFNVLFDTGSTDFWVYSSCYNPITEIGKHHVYNHTCSSSYHPANTKHEKNIQYFGGKVCGSWSCDTVSIAGCNIETEFMEVTEADKVFLHFLNDGIVGLQYKPKYGNIVSKICEKAGGKNEFSFYFPSSHSDKGELILCGEDESKYKAGTMNFVKEVYPLGHWYIGVESIQLKYAERNCKLTTQTKAAVATGTNRIFGPKKIIEKLFKKIKARPIKNYEGENQVDCDTVHLLPKVTFCINGKNYALEGEDYTRKVHANALEGEDYTGKVSGYNKMICQLLINPLEIEFWILGDIFIQKYYTVFDIYNHRIGFAERNQY